MNRCTRVSEIFHNAFYDNKISLSYHLYTINICIILFEILHVLLHCTVKINKGNTAAFFNWKNHFYALMTAFPFISWKSWY